MRSSSQRWAPHFTFGLRQEWVELYCSAPKDWRRSSSLGPAQVSSLRAWLYTCGLREPDGEPSRVAHLIISREPATLGWQLAWSNTIFSFVPAAAYAKRPLGNPTTSRELLGELMADFPGRSARTLMDGVCELVGLLEHTPIGDELGQGIVTPTRPRTVRRVALAYPHAEALAHAMRRLFQREGRRVLRVSEDLVWPWVVFGCERDEALLRLEGVRGDWLRIEPEAVTLLVSWEELDELALF